MKEKIVEKNKITEIFQRLEKSESMTPQQRGFELEKLIHSVLHYEQLEPKTGYRPKGEQIDGSFFWGAQTFLIEAKWTKDRLPVSSIYAFKGKLDGKFHTTNGIFISMSGYGTDVEEALKFGKSLNILLFDQDDMKNIFNGDTTFLETLKYKLRVAGDTGSLNVRYNLKKEVQEISEKSSIDLKFKGVNRPEKDVPLVNDILVFVEGYSDIRIVNNIIEPINNFYNLSYKIEPLNGAFNVRNLPALINIYSDFHKLKGVIVVLDSDQSTSEMNDSIIPNIAKQLHNSSMSVNPIFLFLNEFTKKKFTSSSLPIEELKSNTVFNQLETYIRDIAEYYYDPVREIPQEAMEGAMACLEWNFEEGNLEGTDESYDMPFSINSLEDLVEYLEERIVNALNAEMPLEWLKSQTDFDYRYEVQEFLLDNYSDKIDKLGWNSKDL